MSKPTRLSIGLSRRELLQGTAGAMAAAVGLPGLVRAADDKPWLTQPAATRGRIRQSVCAWCFTKSMPLETLARHAAAMGVKSIELVEPKEWPTLKKYGLVCALTSSHGFVD